MNSLELAKRTLEEGGYTCVVAGGGEVIFKIGRASCRERV